MAELLESLHIEWPLLIAQIVNFLILMAVLGRFVYKPLIRLLEQRREIIARSMEKSQQLDVQFREAQERRAKELAEARREAQGIIEQAKNVAEDERQKIQEHTKKEIAEMIARAEKELTGRKEEMRQDLQREMKTLLAPALERILRDAVDEESQRRILAHAAEQIKLIYK